MSRQETLAEEFEVLESIYPEELEKLEDDVIQISVAPEEQVPDEELRLLLRVEYPAEYPDVIPNLSIDATEGEMSAEEEETLMTKIKASAEESLGMAQTFSVVTTLIECMAEVVENRIKQKQAVKAKKEADEEEAERRRVQGTQVTQESFNAWRLKFNKERQAKKKTQDEEKMREMSNKEKEEFKKYASRLTGRQLFERNRDLATADDTLVEEGAESVDVSKFNREEAALEEEEERLHFSDSD
ncbi:hypothetical protein FRC04_003069 [Tulasnella sp. 424]|nr:hypothetical protein FRC04_003069 [Tulasnella sp. 424]KAG8981140.1 hypothetical protein FRC05_004040 [Tulasnella sp. 425]